jgi:flagellar biosynthetic protein FliR
MTVDPVMLSAWSSPVFLLILFRLGGLFLSAPIFAGSHLPVSFKAGLALSLAVSLYPLLSNRALPARVMEPSSLALSIVGEVAIGVVIGLAARLLFVGVSLAGEMAGVQMGLGIANVVDPQFPQQASVVAQFMELMTILTFMSLHGHHAFLEAVWASFESIPLGMFSGAAAAGAASVLVTLFGKGLILAIKLSSPIMVAVLITNVAIGLLARVVPQLNFFAFGLSVTFVVGLLTLLASLPLLTHIIGISTGQVRLELFTLLRSLSHAPR